MRSAADTSKLVAALIEYTAERASLYDERIAKTRELEGDAVTHVKANNSAWAQMNVVSKLTGRPESLFAAQGEALQELYVYRTRLEGLIFAKQLTEELTVEFSALKAEIDRCSSTIGDAVKKYNDRLAERIKDESGTDLRAQLVRFYEPTQVRTVGRNLIRDENEQRTQTTKVRLALIQRLGDHPDFAAFNQRIGVGDFMDVLDKESAANSQTAHNNLVQNPKERLLGVSIVGKLKERYGNNSQDLRTFVADLVGRAGSFLPLDQSEMRKIGAGIPTGVQTAISRLTIVIPRAPEEAEFVSKLKQAFEGAHQGETEFIDSDSKPNEIVLVSLTNLFPVRYVKQLSFLKQKYDNRTSGPNAERAKLELHTEGDGAQFPRLYVPAQSEIQRDAIPSLLLAKAMALIQPSNNRQTGKTELLFLAKDESGFDTDPIFCGTTLTESLNKLSYSDVETIRGYVSKQLNLPEYQPNSRRAELQKAIVAEVDAIKAERGNNVQDELYHRFLDGGKSAVAILKREK